MKMKDPVLHLIKEMAHNQKEINELVETNNHLLTELIKQVQIDCNEQDLTNEIKETLITGGA